MGQRLDMIAYDPKAPTFEDARRAWKAGGMTVVMDHVQVQTPVFLKRDHRVIAVEEVPVVDGGPPGDGGPPSGARRTAGARWTAARRPRAYPSRTACEIDQMASLWMWLARLLLMPRSFAMASNCSPPQ